MAGGRPTAHTEEIADEMLARLASGEPITRICQDKHMPGISSVYRWLASNAEFREQYARAREDQADTLADDIVRIADEPPPPDAETGKIDSAWVAWQRNRVEARKWTASKMKPKKYGEKTETTHTGSVEVKHVTREIIDHADD